MITQPTKSKYLFESFKERVIVSVGDYFCCIHIFSAKLLLSSQTFFNFKIYSKTRDTWVRCTFNLHINMRRSNLSCFIYWLYKRRIGGRSYSPTADLYWVAFCTNKTKPASSTEINPLSLIHTHMYWASTKREALLAITRNSNLQYNNFFHFSVAKSSKACGKRRETLKS